MFKSILALAILVLVVGWSVSAQPNVILLPDGRHPLGCQNGQPITLEPPNVANCPTATPTGFLETFDGAPAAPQSWRPASWDVVVHSRDRETWVQPHSMMAQHGSECQPPPESHLVDSYEETVFLCNSHLMTSINSGGGYAVIYLTPSQLVNLTTGETVIRFDVSTLRTSGRDWWDIWITPYSDNLATPLEDWLPDLNGEPRNAIHIRMKFGTPGNLTGAFEGFVIKDFIASPLPLRRTAGYETVLAPSAKLRETFELRLSPGYIKFGLPAYNLWWLDTSMPVVNWPSAVVQIGHHSYNPLKECAICSPGTWHWDNISISPAIPFTIIRADRRAIDPSTPTSLFFPQPAPAGAHLRFSGIGSNIQVSYDNGVTWQAAAIQAQEENASDHFRTYWTAIPAGVSRVLVRGQAWWGGRPHVRDISIWSLEREDAH